MAVKKDADGTNVDRRGSMTSSGPPDTSPPRRLFIGSLAALGAGVLGSACQPSSRNAI
jgi:hypothetical protein